MENSILKIFGSVDVKITPDFSKGTYLLGTIQVLRKHIFGLFSPHPPTL